MTEKHCENCKFSRYWANPDKKIVGDLKCHRNPPVMGLMGVKVGVKVDPNYICGEWRSQRT